EEHVHDRAALERRELLHLALERGGEGARQREQPLDVVLRQIGDRDEMPPPGAAWREQLVSDQRCHFSHSVLAFGDEKDAVDFVHLDELHLDALAAGGRKVLADVVGPDGELAVAAIDEAGELHPRRPAVLEEGLDRCADRPPGVEDVVDEHAGHALEREIQLRRLDYWLGMDGPLAAADDDIVALESDVDASELDLDAAEVVD